MMDNTFKATMDFATVNAVIDGIDAAMNASRISLDKSLSEKLDFFMTRLVVAAAQPNLLSVYNRFLEIIDASTSGVTAAMLTACASPDAPVILKWLREQPRIALTLIPLSAKERQTVINAYVGAASTFEPIHPRPKFDVNIRAYVLQALAHGDDIKAGNNTLFRRGGVDGGVRLPYYSANAIGHGLREALAEHFLQTLGFRLNKNSEQFDVWFYHLLYSGGILGEGAIPKTFEARLQGAAAGGLKSDGVRELRDLLPWFSLLGGVTKSPMEGNVYIYDLRPECREWGNGQTPVHELFDWRFMVRLDNYEGRISKAEAKKQERRDGNISLPVNTEVLKEGTYLEGGLNIGKHAQPMECAALAKGLQILQQQGVFGGKKHRGHGLLEIQYTDRDDRPLNLDSQPYDAFLRDRRADILRYIREIGANPAEV